MYATEQDKNKEISTHVQKADKWRDDTRPVNECCPRDAPSTANLHIQKLLCRSVQHTFGRSSCGKHLHSTALYLKQRLSWREESVRVLHVVCNWIRGNQNKAGHLMRVRWYAANPSDSCRRSKGSADLLATETRLGSSSSATLR